MGGCSSVQRTTYPMTFCTAAVTEGSRPTAVGGRATSLEMASRVPVHMAPDTANSPVGLRRLLWAPAKSDGEPRKIASILFVGDSPK